MTSEVAVRDVEILLISTHSKRMFREHHCTCAVCIETAMLG